MKQLLDVESQKTSIFTAIYTFWLHSFVYDNYSLYLSYTYK